jgi:hypothetical protein
MIRGEKMIIDTDLASFYGVSTIRLNKQVKRNRYRFPRDFFISIKYGRKELGGRKMRPP